MDSRDVTVVVCAAPINAEIREPLAKASPTTIDCELPVPASAFAPANAGGGDSCRSSTDHTPFATSIITRTDMESNPGSCSAQKEECQGEAADDEHRPEKRQCITRTVSINTVLQRVGSKEAPLAESIGLAPQTVQEFIPHMLASKGGRRSEDETMDTIEIVEKLWGRNTSQPTSPSLPKQEFKKAATNIKPPDHTQSKSSRADCSEIVEQEPNASIIRSMSMERALHPPLLPTAAQLTAKKTSAESGTVSSLQSGQHPILTAQEPTVDKPKNALWQGRVKHLLKTAEGISVVDLFDATALVPEKLLEQMPPSIFVSAIAGRANVKLGKHYVVQCRFGSINERQKQKLSSLAMMKLVAICELQHCSITFVPFTDDLHGLRVVGFMIADE